MTSRSQSQPPEPKSMDLMKQNIPVMLTDLATFDNRYAIMKERFKQEMMKIDQQMKKFSSDLMNIYGETSIVQTSIGNSAPHDGNSTGESATEMWEALRTSPLLIGEGTDKCLKLQFDVSQFDPAEINVKLLDDTLVVTASHEEKTADTTVYREYNRQFKLPPDMDPELLTSTLSRDGVLTVEAPIILPMPLSDDTNSGFSECQ